MPAYRLATLQDFVKAYESDEFGARAYAGLGVLAGSLQKTDYPLLTSTSGAYSAYYGPELWAQINLATNTFGCLPKVPYPKKFGWRAYTAAPAVKAAYAADGGAIADTVIGSFAQISNVPAIAYRNFDAGVIEQYSAEGGQAIDWESHRDANGDVFAKGLNQALLTDVDTLAGDAIESIDRIASSYSVVNAGLCTAGDADIYNLDRDAAASWSDAITLHASGTDRDFDINYANTLARTVEQGTGSPDVGQRYWLTKHDLHQRWGEWLQPNQTFPEGMFKTDAVGGIQSAAGADGAFSIGKYQQKPIIVDADVPADTIGRLYYLNTKYLRMGTAVPVKYLEVGGGEQNMLLLGKFATEGMFWMAGDPLCTGFFTMGQARDFK